MGKALRAWAITYSDVELLENFPDNRVIQTILKSLDADKWSFQLEKGGLAGHLHFQIHLVLNEPMNGTDLRAKFRDRLRHRKSWAKGCMHTTPMHSQSDHEVYVMKAETRQEGPWSNKIVYQGQDLVSTKKYFAWQRSLLYLAKRKSIDQRALYVIIDPIGNIGKSEVTKHLAYQEDALVIPLGLSAAQVKAAITSTHARKNYIVDLPRNGGNQQDIYSCCEEVKRGFVISSFHGKLRNLFMLRPNIFIFTNKIPELYLMSFDMWNLFTVDPKTRRLRNLDKWQILAWQKKSEQERENKSIYSFIKDEISTE